MPYDGWRATGAVALLADMRVRCGRAGGRRHTQPRVTALHLDLRRWPTCDRRADSAGAAARSTHPRARIVAERQSLGTFGRLAHFVTRRDVPMMQKIAHHRRPRDRRPRRAVPDRLALAGRAHDRHGRAVLHPAGEPARASAASSRGSSTSAARGRTTPRATRRSCRCAAGRARRSVRSRVFITGLMCRS